MSAGPLVRSRPIPPPWPYEAAALRAVENTVVHLQVTRRDDPARKRPCVLRFLGGSDLDQAEALYGLVISKLPHPHILRRENRAYLAHHVNDRGRLIGAFCDGRMVAFAVLSFPGEDSDNLGLDLGFDRNRRQRICHLELSGVEPDYRGNKLHIKMNEMRSAFAAVAGYRYLCGTVSPRNPYSLASHFSAGMTIRKLALKYGMDRYIIYRDCGERCVYAPGVLEGAVWRPCHDIAGQQALLADDYWGVAVRQGHGGDYAVAFVPSARIGIEPIGDAP